MFAIWLSVRSDARPAAPPVAIPVTEPVPVPPVHAVTEAAAPPTSIPAPEVPHHNGALSLPAPGEPPLVVHRIPTTDPVVFVTIDDGWAKDPSVLPWIASQHMPVTAFLIDRIVNHTLPYWQQLAAQGGLIEDHTMRHLALKGRSAAAQRAEICPPVDDYAHLFGRRPDLFRPPYGSMDDTTVTAAGSCGLQAVVLWDVQIERGKVTRATPGPIQAGDIVLLHWGPSLADDLRVLVRLMDDHGLHAAQLEDYLVAAA